MLVNDGMSDRRSATPGPGRLVREARERRRISRAAFARQLGVGAGTVLRWENESNRPQARNLTAICTSLGLDDEAMARLWGFPQARSASVIPLRPGQELDGHGLTEQGNEFVSAVLCGLRDGHATSESWLEAAVRTAKLLGVPWNA